MFEYVVDHNVWFDQNAWHFVTQDISYISRNEIWDIIFPQGAPFNTPTVIYYESETQGYFNLFVKEGGRQKTTYLYDFLSDFLQYFLTFCGRYNYSDNLDMLRGYQKYAYEMLLIFNACCQFRLNFSWFIIFNPYTQPFDTLRVLCDWWLNALSGGIPLVIGIDYSGTIAITLVSLLADFLRTLAFTMPFRISEGDILTVEDMKNLDDPALAKILVDYGGQQVRRFHNLPAIWVDHPIPNNLREYWLMKKPYITKHLIENYYEDLGVDFLPNRLLKLLNEKVKTEAVINTLFHNFENISTNFVCLKSNILSLDLIHFYPHL